MRTVLDADAEADALPDALPLVAWGCAHAARRLRRTVLPEQAEGGSAGYVLPGFSLSVVLSAPWCRVILSNGRDGTTWV